MSIIYALVGTNRALRHSNSNNQIVIGDFNSFRFFGDTLYIILLLRLAEPCQRFKMGRFQCQKRDIPSGAALTLFEWGV